MSFFAWTGRTAAVAQRLTASSGSGFRQAIWMPVTR